ncbi:hypothetical protein [uncultured Sphingomonas sp.]
MPRAINCPTVEQFAAGIVQKTARGTLANPSADSRYRTDLTVTWGS